MKYLPILSLFMAAGLYSIGTAAADDKAEDMKHLLDFENAETAPKWLSVNDGVMGGLSKGTADIKHGSLHFRGDISLENNGGFSSIRSLGNYDFSGKEALVMLVKGDGRTYQLRLATDARYKDSAVSYGAEFTTEIGKWVEVKIPFEALSPTWRGKKLDGPAFDASEVEELGILIGDGKPGKFSLTVDWIAVK